MKNLFAVILVALLLAVGLIAYNVLVYTVDETEKAVVVQFGEIIRIVDEPGFYLKSNVLQNVILLDDRLMSVDIKPAPVITSDKQRLTVDTYTLWRIHDSRKFVETMRGLRGNAERRLDDIIYSLIRDVLGQVSFEGVLKRDFLSEVKTRAQTQVEEFGIEIVDVRIKRADLPEANQKAVYERMVSERQQIAERYRAEGDQQSKRIRAEADRDIQIILAKASKRSEELKGEGDAVALKTYTSAYSRDPNFFIYWRTLNSYPRTLGADTMVVMSTRSDYLTLLDFLKLNKMKQVLDK